ncbi:hypothetical protein [uncultured Metabacillus sp.]|uniref:hypothetical protein n=1 Tax=uncultured Metabacillus sp. TaxID=2860135 RepID=UPI0026337C0F|nr:hypothetical protein [uncultured Metabacillus sp.]
MKLFKISKGKKEEIKSVEHELINFLDTSIRSKDTYSFSKKNTSYKEDYKNLLSTITALVLLLTRNRQGNSLNMHMIMYLVEEVEQLHLTISDNDYLKQQFLIKKANLILESCLDTMEFAEIETRNYEVIQRFIFKDEKELLNEYFKINNTENNEVK